MSKRHRLTQAERKLVYNKTNGHCAYCGCPLVYKDMQVDHVIALYGHNGEDKLGNMLPSCRSCNHYKGTLTLDDFRDSLEQMPKVLLRDSVTYKIAVRYGLVKPNPKKVEFYFEALESEGER